MVDSMLNSDKNILRRHKIYVEISIFLVYFALTFADSITTNFIRYRTCYVILGFKETDCALLGGSVTNRTITAMERKVQPSAVVITSTLSIIQSLIPPLLCFFIGPWCKEYGRKPVMLYSTFALAIQYATMVFISAVPHISAWYILLAQILVCASGGVPAFVAVTFSYIADTITEQYRGVRISILEAVRSSGILLGMSTGVLALQSSSYTAVYSISVAILLIAYLFIWLYVPESVKITQTENKVKGFFDFASLLDTVKTTFRNRENYNRVTLLTAISITVFYTIAIVGNISVSSMYFQNQFHWNATSTNNYNIVVNLTTIIGGMVCVYVLHEKLYCGELTVILTGLLSLASGSLVLALATSTSIIHLGGCMQCFGPAVLSMAKSLVSKLVPYEEVGTLFAVIAAFEAVFALVGASFFAVIYNITPSSSTFLFVITGLYVSQLLFVSALLFIRKYWNPLTFVPMEDEGD